MRRTNSSKAVEPVFDPSGSDPAVPARPASLRAIEAELTPDQLQAVKRVAVFLACAAYKIAREKEVYPE